MSTSLSANNIKFILLKSKSFTMDKKTFKILSLDSGGIRGLYSAVILKNIQDTYNVNLKDHFDLIVGSSTGSILAGIIACDIPLEEIIKLYEYKGKLIFKKNLFGFMGLFKSKYDNKNFKNIIHETFQDIRLEDIEKPLMIFASDIVNCATYIYKSKYVPDQDHKDGKVKIADAMLASCAAPTFFDPVKVNGLTLADGGLWANNPSMIALLETIGVFHKKMNDIKILSIGSGKSKKTYDSNHINRKRWGLLNGWKGGRLIEYIFDLSVLSSNNMCQLMLKDHYLRVSSPTKHAMDDVTKLQDLKVYAKETFLEYQDRIEKFLDD